MEANLGGPLQSLFQILGSDLQKMSPKRIDGMRRAGQGHPSPLEGPYAVTWKTPFLTISNQAAISPTTGDVAYIGWKDIGHECPRYLIEGAIVGKRTQALRISDLHYPRGSDELAYLAVGLDGDASHETRIVWGSHSGKISRDFFELKPWLRREGERILASFYVSHTIGKLTVHSFEIRPDGVWKLPDEIFSAPTGCTLVDWESHPRFTVQSGDEANPYRLHIGNAQLPLSGKRFVGGHLVSDDKIACAVFSDNSWWLDIPGQKPMPVEPPFEPKWGQNGQFFGTGFQHGNECLRHLNSGNTVPCEAVKVTLVGDGAYIISRGTAGGYPPILYRWEYAKEGQGLTMLLRLPTNDQLSMRPLCGDLAVQLDRGTFFWASQVPGDVEMDRWNPYPIALPLVNAQDGINHLVEVRRPGEKPYAADWSFYGGSMSLLRYDPPSPR